MTDTIINSDTAVAVNPWLEPGVQAALERAKANQQAWLAAHPAEAERGRDYEHVTLIPFRNGPPERDETGLGHGTASGGDDGNGD